MFPRNGVSVSALAANIRTAIVCHGSNATLAATMLEDISRISKFLALGKREQALKFPVGAGPNV